MAALYAVYGPQTVLVCARPKSGRADADGGASTSGSSPSETHCVQELVLTPTGWRLQRDTISIGPSSKVRQPHVMCMPGV